MEIVKIILIPCITMLVVLSTILAAFMVSEYIKEIKSK
jgi:hypothetical protein